MTDGQSRHSRRTLLRAAGITPAAGPCCRPHAGPRVGPGTHAAAGRGGQLPGDARVELRVHLPRDDEPVLRPDAVRDRGRVGAARHDVPVDGLGDVGHPARWSTPSTRRSPAGPTASPSRSSTSRRSTTRSNRRSTPASPSSPTTPTPRTPGWRTSARTSSGRAWRWASASSRSSARARSALFIATPGQLNIQPRIDGAIQAIEDSGAAIEYEQIETSADAPRGAQPHRGLVPRQHRRGRDVRRRRRQHAGGRPGRATARRPGQRAQGRRRLRPVARHRASSSPMACSTSPSTSSRTSRASCRCSTSTSPSCPVASCCRRRRTPASCSSTRTRRSCSSRPSSRFEGDSEEQQIVEPADDPRTLRRAADR